MVLKIEGLECGYGRRSVVKGADLVVDNGEVAALLGPIGSGKTTLIKCILGIARVFRGSVNIDGVHLSRASRRDWSRLVAYVSQSLERPLGMRAIDIVLLGRLPHIGFRYNDRDYEIAYKALGELGISHLAHRSVNELSGGEYQLIHLARALAQGARVLLLDEPVSNLDIKHQVVVMEKIREAARDKGVSVLMSMHDVNLALKYSDSVVFMRGGKIVARGPPQVVGPAIIKEVYDVDAKVVWLDGEPKVVL